MKSVILTAFDGKNNVSKRLVESIPTDCTKLILPNDNEKSKKLLRDTIAQVGAVCVILTGQKPKIKNKIAVEAVAKENSTVLHTAMDCTVTKEMLKKNGYDAYISKGCGTSYCNSIYYECLALGVNCIFLHLPNEKNADNFDNMVNAVKNYINSLASVPVAL